MYASGLLLFGFQCFGQQTELDSLRQVVNSLEYRISKLEKLQGPTFSDNYYDDIDKAFLSVGYYQGVYTINDSIGNTSSYGFNIHYAQDKISGVLNGSWGGSKFFSSFYLGYNFYSRNSNIALTPLVGAISWGENIWDFKEAKWSFGIALTGMGKVPVAFSFYKHSTGMAFSLAYRFALTGRK